MLLKSLPWVLLCFLSSFQLGSSAGILAEDARPTQQSIRQLSLTRAQTFLAQQEQAQEALIRRLSLGTFNDNVMSDFVEQVAGQVNRSLTMVEDTMAPYDSAISSAIGNFLLTPFVQSVTTGASLFMTVGAGHLNNKTALQELTSSYDNLIVLAKQTRVPIGQLTTLNKELRSLL